MMVSPFAKLNLIRNPFGELQPAERAELAVVDTPRWLELLRQPTSAVQFIGPGGHGKTTHLLALAHRLPQAAYVYLPEDGPPPSLPRARPVLIDEAQRLRWWQRRQVLAVGGPLALGTHEDLTPALRRAGLTVVTVEVAADQSPERLADILNRRIEASRAGDAPVPRVDLPQAIELRRRFGADIRQIERYLYFQFQQLATDRATWPPAR